MVDAFCQIYKQEGFLSLYSGYLFIVILIVYKSKRTYYVTELALH